MRELRSLIFLGNFEQESNEPIASKSEAGRQLAAAAGWDGSERVVKKA